MGFAVLQNPMEFSSCEPQHPFPDPVGHISMTPQPHLPSIMSICPATTSSGLIHAMTVMYPSGVSPVKSLYRPPSLLSSQLASTQESQLSSTQDVTRVSIPLKYMELFPDTGGGEGGLGGAFNTSGKSRFKLPSHVAYSNASEMISPSGISADEDAACA